MDSGIYAAYTGLLARTQALDTTANNLANVATNGFRAEHGVFERTIVGSGDHLRDSQIGQSVNSFGILGSNDLDLGQGHLSVTGNPLDLAIDGDGVFAVRNSTGLSYTRNGNFSVSTNGILETAKGASVLDVNRNKIVIPAGTIAVASDGSVSVSNAQGSAIVGQIGVFGFGSKDALKAAGGDNLIASSTETPIKATGTLIQGAIEGSNEDAIAGSLQLVLVQRQAEMMQKALSVFDNNMDRTAAEDLSKV